MSDPVRLLDVNVLVAMSVDVHVHHRAARAAVGEFVDGWATCPLTESALIRLLLNPAVPGRTVTPAEVLTLLGGLRAQPAWQFIDDRSSLADPVIDTRPLVGSKQVTDFHLVNLAASSGAVLATLDARIRNALSPVDRRHVQVIESR